MSERYGTIDEVYELMPDFEDWVRKEIEKVRSGIYTVATVGEAQVMHGRWEAFQDVLSWWGVG
ncbi:hypothetical protein DQP57_00160 [Mycobacterium colombiense]|uniref:Uncharacterized protein n=1 Tax=Mycobacterium colombiense TaxID=339268 RepID=A0A329MBM9_9MYCO|nr:hypothetical protein [Mycobacterium colombiense]RAV17475.1 hypothetical protein DQP57_00160 [Mycobacterium colombiense]